MNDSSRDVFLVSVTTFFVVCFLVSLGAILAFNFGFISKEQITYCEKVCSENDGLMHVEFDGTCACINGARFEEKVTRTN